MSRLREVFQLPEDRAREQYFFTRPTLERLLQICAGSTALVCCPSLAAHALDKGKADIVALDVDERLRAALGSYFYPYDLNRGVFCRLRDNPRARELQQRFDTVVIDPPYSLVTPRILVTNALGLLKDQGWSGGSVYVGYPETGIRALESAFLDQGFVGEVVSDIPLEYINPPRVVGRKALRLCHFARA